MNPTHTPDRFPTFRPLAFATVVLLTSCAVPATKVSVPTMSMGQALQQARRDSLRNLATAPVIPPRLGDGVAGVTISQSTISRFAIPRPAVRPPDIRMAFLYSWVDSEHNKHFGSWVAIPVSDFAWADGEHASR